MKLKQKVFRSFFIKKLFIQRFEKKQFESVYITYIDVYNSALQRFYKDFYHRMLCVDCIIILLLFLKISFFIKILKNIEYENI